jgi:uncharacterized membrane protein YqhA
MKSLIEKTRYLNLVAVIALLVAAAGSLVLGSFKTYETIRAIIITEGKDPSINYYLIRLVDAFLIAIVLYVFAVSIYALFIGKLDLPDWMLAHNLHELKAKLSSMIILVAAVLFVEHLIEGKDALQLLYLGGAVALVSAALIAFSVLGEKD